MKIDKNRYENQGLARQAEQAAKAERGSRRSGTSTIHASELNLLGDDSIFARKKKAMADAMGIIGKQFQADGKIDEDLAERRGRIADSKAKADAALKEKQALSEEQKKLQEAYGVEPDSQEQADLELRIKMKKALDPRSHVDLTKEEIDRLNEMGPMTDYQREAMELEASKGVWEDEIEEAHKVISTETQVIRATEQEMLKHHGMVDAQRTAQASLQTASKEIIGMAIQESMDKIEEELDETVEKAEEQKEEREELEALRDEKKAEQEAQNEQLSKLPDMQKLQSEVDQQLQEILERQKLLEEDLKGIQVDQNI